jgi:single-strand DNA-binding protein
VENLNVWTGTGNLTRDAELKEVGETEVASFSIAVNGRKDEVMFLNCDLWRPGKVTEYLTRGKSVAITGTLRCRKYEKDGQKREAWSVDVKSLQLLGSPGGRTEAF